MSSAKTIISNYRYKNKVEEVKEVIQSKSDLDIIKVLEYFENDVGKTIDAFINGKTFSLSYLFFSYIPNNISKIK
jgi:hypothetical protein